MLAVAHLGGRRLTHHRNPGLLHRRTLLPRHSLPHESVRSLLLPPHLPNTGLPLGRICGHGFRYRPHGSYPLHADLPMPTDSPNLGWLADQGMGGQVPRHQYPGVRRRQLQYRSRSGTDCATNAMVGEAEYRVEDEAGRDAHVQLGDLRASHIMYATLVHPGLWTHTKPDVGLCRPTDLDRPGGRCLRHCRLSASSPRPHSSLHPQLPNNQPIQHQGNSKKRRIRQARIQQPLNRVACPSHRQRSHAVEWWRGYQQRERESDRAGCAPGLR